MTDDAETEPGKDAEIDLDSFVPEDFSDDQRTAVAALARALLGAGVDLDALTADPDDGDGKNRVLAVLGKAGSGKTHLLAWLVKRMIAAGKSIEEILQIAKAF